MSLDDRTSASLVRFVGRVERLPSGHARYAWPGTGWVARFKGKGISVRLDDPGNLHSVWIDGSVRAPVKAVPQQYVYVLATGLPDGEHVVEMYKRTEAFVGATLFRGLDVEAGELLRPPPPSARKLEIIGDSISCGYGNEGKGASCGFSPETENHALSYGAVMARALGAELVTIAWSGKGVVKNYNGEPGELLPALYDRVLPQEQVSKWDFSWQPDAVIINLGTNDFSTEPAPPQSEFASAYQEFLRRIRGKYPSAFILCTVGPMLELKDRAKARGAIAEAVAARRNAGDERIVAHEMTTANENPGCDSHPGVTTHAKMAEELTRTLQSHLGW